MEHMLDLHPPLRQRRAEAPDTVVRLAANATLARRLPAGACVAVQSGRIWLTQTGDASDYVIDAGERHVVARHGRVVMEPLSPHATLRVTLAAPPAHPGFP